MQKFISKSEEETSVIAENLAKKSRSRIFALTGNLGTGKTTFAQGFAKGLGIKEKIISPTFVLIRVHQIPDTVNILYHIDLYRLGNITDLKHLGLEEILSDQNNIVLIEWAEKIKKFLPKTTTWINLKNVNKNQRQIIINDY